MDPDPSPDALPAPPCISFEPSLQIQRQTAVHDTLRALAASPRFAAAKLTSLLDVGCGDAQLLQRLVPCDDALPLRCMTGIDVEPPPPAVWASLGTHDAADRWTPLTISLLQGSFEQLSPAAVGHHDVIVSVEGDPPPPPSSVPPGPLLTRRAAVCSH